MKKIEWSLISLNLLSFKTFYIIGPPRRKKAFHFLYNENQWQNLDHPSRLSVVEKFKYDMKYIHGDQTNPLFEKKFGGQKYPREVNGETVADKLYVTR